MTPDRLRKLYKNELDFTLDFFRSLVLRCTVKMRPIHQHGLKFKDLGRGIVQTCTIGHNHS